jgi:hypothetical protein
VVWYNLDRATKAPANARMVTLSLDENDYLWNGLRTGDQKETYEARRSFLLASSDVRAKEVDRHRNAIAAEVQERIARQRAEDVARAAAERERKAQAKEAKRLAQEEAERASQALLDELRPRLTALVDDYVAARLRQNHNARMPRFSIERDIRVLHTGHEAQELLEKMERLIAEWPEEAGAAARLAGQVDRRTS